MAPTRVMASSSSSDSDLRRQGEAAAMKGVPGQMSMEDLFRSVCGAAAAPAGFAAGGLEGKAAEELWREITGGGGGGRRKGADGADGSGGGAEVTLEDFLARDGGAAREDDPAAADPAAAVDNQMVPIGNDEEGGGRGGRGRRKRQAVDPVDRAAMQRQKRMIKNRESAARSRERKQAYTVELETLVTQLEEENARLVREKEDMEKSRRLQLMENLKPVTEERKPRKLLRRTRSMEL